jgi:drug/metabolite transporter (DMT)-like permease
MVALGVLCEGISFVWNFRLIALAGSLIASTVIYFVPVVAITISVVFTSEELTWFQLAGCSVVLLGAAVGQGRLKFKTR